MTINSTRAKQLAVLGARLVRAATDTDDFGVESALGIHGFDSQQAGQVLALMSAVYGTDMPAGGDMDTGNGDPGNGDDTGIGNSWLYRLYMDVADDGSGQPGPRALVRCSDYLMAMPDFEAYSAIQKQYAGTEPACDRPGKDGESKRPRSGRRTDELLSAGLDFLRIPERAEYIRTGRSELVRYCDKDALQILHANGVFTMADLAGLTDKDVLSMDGITVPAVAQLHEAIEVLKAAESPLTD